MHAPDFLHRVVVWCSGQEVGFQQQRGVRFHVTVALLCLGTVHSLYTGLGESVITHFLVFMLLIWENQIWHLLLEQTNQIFGGYKYFPPFFNIEILGGCSKTYVKPHQAARRLMVL